MTAIKQNERTNVSNVKKRTENISPSLDGGDSRKKKHTIKKALEAEKVRFFEAVSGVVTMLVKQHGYSRARANSLVLAEIRQDDEQPTENEIFQIMKSSMIGLDDARRAATVANAFKRSCKSAKDSKVDAIRLLTSQLETSTFLRKIPFSSSVLERPSTSDSVPDFKSLLNNQKTEEISELNQSQTTHLIKPRNCAPRPMKSKSSMRSVSHAKMQRKRQLTVDENKDEVDAAVEQKALKDPNNSESCHRTISPSPSITRKRNASDGSVQPALKRSRCDSV